MSTSRAATVTYGGRRWSVARGQQLTAGRSSSCTVRLPDDEHLSRHAASLRVLDDCVLIRNTSASKPFVLRPAVGEDRVVEPGAATTSLPFDRFRIVLAGRGARPIAIDVDATALTVGPRPGAPAGTAGPTVSSPVTFTAGQHRMLVELCRPLLTESGPQARPATYAEIAERLGLKPQYVRNVVKQIRESLTGFGVPGLAADETAGPNDDFRRPLARWALWNDWVTAADVAELDAAAGPGAG